MKHIRLVMLAILMKARTYLKLRICGQFSSFEQEGGANPQRTKDNKTRGKMLQPQKFKNKDVND